MAGIDTVASLWDQVELVQYQRNIEAERASPCLYENRVFVEHDAQGVKLT